MAKFKKFTQVNEGKIVYFDGIIDGIVLLAVSEIPYVELCTKENNSLDLNSAISVKIENHEVHVEDLVKVHYSQSISEIAFACGFRDSNYFSMQFKKVMGIPPKKFRFS